MLVDSRSLLAKAYDIVDGALQKYEGGQSVKHSEETTRRINQFINEMEKILDKKISDTSASDQAALNKRIKNACRALYPEIVKTKVPYLDKWAPPAVFSSMSAASREEYAIAKMDYVRKIFNEL